VGETSLARPHIVDEVLARIADRNQQQTRHRVEAIGGPCAATTMLDARGILPRLGSGLAGPGNGVPTPNLGAVVRAEGHHFAADSQVSTGLAHEDYIVPDERCCCLIFTAAWIHDSAIPKQRAGGFIESDQV